MTVLTSQSTSSWAWTGVVLASGQSSRMGEDKAMLLWGEKPLYQHMGETLKAAGADNVLVNRPGLSSNSIVDIYPGRGPLSGIHAVLKVCQTPALIIIPVDMPLLRPEHLTKLVCEFDGCRPVQYQNYSLPLLLPVNKEVLQAVEVAITSDNRRDYALWRLFEKLGGVSLPKPDNHQDCFSNTNTPEEWKACLNGEN
ncbi:molybdenum cofactor guanylyltransferase [Parendozoicomonas sp. Alg238-R29]|uniref:molybdenum cofactor guanylyltransferase n=1 Tax=Parendozoicomonas sp. Alg238-R29 TaxID=2993446 RepID=UPI00248E5533|nr:molybdenum cofactor guanylyltransferase [Parendozoicomonas sp. Alg238-R29]